jgi:hypothetical protein
MADETTNTPPAAEGLPTMEEVNRQNTETARALAAQDINSHSTAASPDASSGSALDALAAQVNKKHDEEVASQPTAEEKAATEAKAAADKVIADKAAADKAEADKANADKNKVVEEDVAKRSAELFKDSPQLPAGVSPKSSEAFNAIKTKAAQEVINRDKRILELEAQVKERDEKLKDPVPAEVHKELEDLRSFRAKLDVEADPQFKAFDKTIASSQDFIYSQLKKSPAVTDGVIDQIKKIGGPEMCDLSKVFDAIKDPTIQRIVEAKVADIEHAKWQKEEAIKTTKAHVSDYVKKREEEFSKTATAHNDTTKAELNALVKQLPWFASRKADAKADDATKKSVEEHNKFVEETKAQLDAALSDDSPRMRAIMLAATAQLLNLQRVHAATSGERDALKKELTEVKEKLDKLKNASVSRLRENQAPAGGKPVVKKEEQFNAHAGDALDKIRDQVMQERERASTGA